MFRVQLFDSQAATKITMHLRIFCCLQLIIISCADNVHLIRDYFLFKKAKGVVGFSCGELEKDVEIVRIFNDVGITTSIKRIRPNIDVTRFLYSKYRNIGVFLDLGCSCNVEDVLNIFSEASSEHMFDHLHHWLILEEKEKNISETVQLLNDSAFSIITDFTISVPKDDGYVLYDVYNHCKHCGGTLNITKLGTWTNDTGLSISLSENKFIRRRNYHQMKVKVAGVVGDRPKDKDLIKYLEEPNVVMLDNWARFGYALLVHAAEMFNFSYEVTELNYWAKDDRNGPQIAGLNKRIYDLGFLPSVITLERVILADLILPVWPTRTCFLFRTVPSAKSDMTVIFRPFQASVWCVIFVLSIFIILTLWFIWKLNTHPDYGESVLILFAAICQQGLPFQTNHFAGRIAFFQTMIFGLIIYNCYSAAMVSSRLNVPLNKMDDSLYSLVKSKKKLSARKDIYFNILISTTYPDVVYFRKHWESIPENERFQELHAGIRSIMNPDFAYHASPIDAYPIIDREFSKQMICQLTEVHLLRPSILALFAAQNGEFREITKIGLIRMTTAGIRWRQVLRWDSRKPYCDKQKHYVSSVTILETSPILMLLFGGILLSLIICILENAVFRMSGTKSNVIIPKHLKKNRNKNRAIVTRKKKLVPKIKLIISSEKK